MRFVTPLAALAALAAVAAVAALAACDVGADEGRAGSVLTDSAGITIVESSAPVWPAAGRRLEPEPIVRIGGEEAAYQFGFVVTGLLLPGERIAVPEGMSREVRIFGFDGEHVATAGGPGEGPGEFANPAAVFRFRGDSIAVYDQRLARLTIFPPTFDSHRTISSRTQGNFAGFGALGSGELLLYNPGAGYRPDLDAGLQWDTTDVVRMDPADGSGTVVTRLPSRQQIILEDGNTARLMPAHNSVRAAAPDGFYWATTNRYEIRFYDGDGTLRRILRRPVEPRPVEPRMVERFIEANLEQVRQFEGEASVPRYRRRLEEAPRGEVVPLFGRAFVDADERLWVSDSIWPELGATPRKWSVFAPDGRWLGDVHPPERTRIVDSRGDLVLAIRTDEYDVPFVQLHRITAIDG